MEMHQTRNHSHNERKKPVNQKQKKFTSGNGTFFVSISGCCFSNVEYLIYPWSQTIFSRKIAEFSHFYYTFALLFAMEKWEEKKWMPVGNLINNHMYLFFLPLRFDWCRIMTREKHSRYNNQLKNGWIMYEEFHSNNMKHNKNITKWSQNIIENGRSENKTKKATQ